MEKNQTATQRFDQVIAQEADALVQDLVNRHPELRGAAIIFDWDLPKATTGSLPAGAWRTTDGLVTPDKCYAMQQQLARFMNHMSKSIERMMAEVLNNYRALQAAMGTPVANPVATDTPEAPLPESQTPPAASRAAPVGPQQGLPFPANQPLAPITPNAAGKAPTRPPDLKAPLMPPGWAPPALQGGGAEQVRPPIRPPVPVMDAYAPAMQEPTAPTSPASAI